MRPRELPTYRLQPLATLGSFLAAAALLFSASARAELTDCAIPWSSFEDNPGFIAEYTFQGVSIADEETSADTTHGPAAVPPEQTDLASGSPGAFPGPEPTPWFGYFNGGTPWDESDPATMEDDYLFFRMRVEGDPSKSGAFDSKHWNILLDVDADGYKEYWVDLEGDYQSGGSKPDRLNVLYDDANRQDIDDPEVARVEAFTAYAAADNGGGCGSPGLSHTRVVEIGDGTGDYWIEFQVPMTAFNDGRGNQVVYPDSPVAFVFSTGASNTDPLQKDFMNDLEFLTLQDPIRFGDVVIPNGRPLIQFIDADRESADFYFLGDDVWVTVTDRLANTDSTVLESIVVTISDPVTGDDEIVTLWETTPSSGIFTNLGGATEPVITTPSPVPSPPTAWIPAVRTGPPTIDEDWTVEFDSATGAWTVTGSVSGVQTATATHGVPYLSDGGEISFTLYQDTPVDGTTLTFTTAAADPLSTSSLPAADDDGDLETLAGNAIVASYTNASFLTVNDTAYILGPCQAFIEFTRANGLPSTDFQLTNDAATSDRLYVNVRLLEANQDPAVVETISVQLTGNDLETVTLTETGADTGEFRNLSGLETQVDDGAVTFEDALWEDVDGGVVTATYDYLCDGQNRSVSTSADLFYVDGGGRIDFVNGAATTDVDVYGNGEPVFLRVTDANACTTLDRGFASLLVTVTTSSGDAETVRVWETFAGSGVFVNRLNDLGTTAGSSVVTSASATFVTDGLAPGDPFVVAAGPDAGSYSVLSVDGENQVTLDGLPLGSTRSDLGFTYQPLLTATADASIVAGDGLLEAADDDLLTASYDDCDDGDLDSSNDIKLDQARYSSPPLMIQSVSFWPTEDYIGGTCHTESVVLINGSTAPVNATGWRISDGDGFEYVVPQVDGADVMVPAGGRIQVIIWPDNPLVTPPPDQLLGSVYYLAAIAQQTDFPTAVFGEPAGTEDADQVLLYSASGDIEDYVGWSNSTTPSADFLGDDAPAVLAGIWQDDAYRDLGGAGRGLDLFRDPLAYDSDVPADWSFAQDDSCTSTPTRALITDFRAWRDRGDVVLEWQTSTEDGTLGFYPARWDDGTESWELLVEEPLPALLDSPQGGSYRFVDNGARGDRLAYGLIELESRDGGVEELVHGPFLVEVEEGGAPTRSPSSPFTAAPRDPIGTETARYQSARADGAAALLARGRRVGKRAKIETRSEGLHRIAVDDLARIFAMPRKTATAWLRTGMFALSHRGEEIAWIHDPTDDSLLFWALGEQSVWSESDVYWLARRRGTVMERRRATATADHADDESFLDLARVEHDRFAGTAAVREPDTDLWFDRVLVADHPSAGRADLELTLPAVAAAGEARVTIEVYSVSTTGIDGEHRLRLQVNGVGAGERAWSGVGRQQLEFAVDASALRTGVNRIEVTAIRPAGVAFAYSYLDSATLFYPRLPIAENDRLVVTASSGPVSMRGFASDDLLVLDVTDPRRPIWLEQPPVTSSNGGSWETRFVSLGTGPRRYAAVARDALLSPRQSWADAPSSLRWTGWQADYLVVAPEELYDAAAELARYRADRGLRTLLVSYEDVLDEFNHGIEDARALRSFLAFAHASWQTPPDHVVLVGHGHIDYRDSQGLGGNLLPPLLVRTPTGLVASDNRFVDFDDDGAPEMAIGRLPVLTAEELLDYLARIAESEARSGEGWRRRSLLVADDNPGGGDAFAHENELLDLLLRSSSPARKVYLSKLGLSAARQRLFDAWADGAGWVNYSGHGGLDRWAHEGLLRNDDVAALGNGHRLPVVTSLSCSINRFELPGWRALGAALTVTPDGGAAAVWSSSAVAESRQSSILGEELYRIVGNGSGSRLLGSAIVRSLRHHVETGGEPWVAQTYVLLGEPVLPLD